jgi:hypothetical protein
MIDPLPIVGDLLARLTALLGNEVSRKVAKNAKAGK